MMTFLPIFLSISILNEKSFDDESKRKKESENPSQKMKVLPCKIVRIAKTYEWYQLRENHNSYASLSQAVRRVPTAEKLP